MPRYIRRRIESVALSLAKSFPVVTILGPRQSGKTTLVREVFPLIGRVLEVAGGRRWSCLAAEYSRQGNQLCHSDMAST